MGLFNGNIFYPYGNTLTYSELLLVPALFPFAPIFAASGNPVLAYNSTLLFFQALSGWAAFFAASRITGNKIAGLVAGIVLAFSPFSTGYYNILIMQVSFAIPLALLSFVRFLESQRSGYLATTLVLVWIQAASVWYFGVPLALLLGFSFVGFILLRPASWRWRTFVVLAAGVAMLLIALLPVAMPYMQTQSEMGFERSLQEAARRPADLLSYLDAGQDHSFYRLADSGRYPGLFPGFTAYALAALALLWTRKEPKDRDSHALRTARRGVRWLLIGTLVAVAVILLVSWRAADGAQSGPELVTSAAVPARGLEIAVVFLLAVSAAGLACLGRSWTHCRSARSLTLGEWAWLLALLTFVFVLLSFGPIILLGGRPVGTGIYEIFYWVFPPLRAIRTPLRIGSLVMVLIGLLDALGFAWLHWRLEGNRLRNLLLIVPVVLLAEYVSIPLRYEEVRWREPPAVYRWLAEQPRDFAFVEWPFGRRQYRDAVHTFWSILHEKRMVHGIGGFTPRLTRQTRRAIAALPDSDAMAKLRRIHPLDYLIANLNDMRGPNRRRWEQWATSPPTGLSTLGRFGDSIVFEISGAAEQASQWVRTFSSDYVARHSTARLGLRAEVEPSEITPFVDVRFNGRLAGRLSVSKDSREFRVALQPPYPRARPNRLRLRPSYELAVPPDGDSRYRIGETGIYAPVDIVAVSGDADAGQFASIRVNGVEASPNRNGLNVVALDPTSGERVGRRRCRLSRRPAGGDQPGARRSRTAAACLERFLTAVPEGSIVVVALRGTANKLPTEASTAGLGAMGGSVELFSGVAEPPPVSTESAFDPIDSYVLVGVKGAPPGTALELAGSQGVKGVVGVERPELVMIVEEFGLEQSPPSRR